MVAPLCLGTKDLKRLILKRIENKYDCNILVTGHTGVGKSTLIFKLLKRFRGFKIEEKLTYSRTELIHLIKDFKNSYCWADELIGSGFKRNFFDREQIELIEILTKYRNHYNVVAGALPIFFTLDKELLKLFRVHLQVIKRGVAVLHLPRQGRMYTDDIWDVKHNKKLEENWSEKKHKNPNFRIPYNKYSTFKAYVFFPPFSDEESKMYEKLKEEKRNISEDVVDNKKNKKSLFIKKLLIMIKDKKIDQDDFFKICEANSLVYLNTVREVRNCLQNEGSKVQLKDLWKKKKKSDLSLVPSSHKDDPSANTSEGGTIKINLDDL